MDAIITEGKADSFAKVLYPEMRVPWTEPLSADEEKATFKELKEIANSTNWERYDEFSYGSLEKVFKMVKL